MPRPSDPARTQVATLLRDVPCPACDRKKLEFALRCDLGLDACLWTANCQSCSTVFEIATGPAPPDPGSLGKAGPRCAKCGGKDLEPVLRCTLATRTCVFQLECVTCRSSSGSRGGP